VIPQLLLKISLLYSPAGSGVDTVCSWWSRQRLHGNRGRNWTRYQHRMAKML